MVKFRKGAIEYEAMQFTDAAKDRVFHFVRCNCYATFGKDGKPELAIQMPDGSMKHAVLGDWVVCEEPSVYRIYKPDEIVREFELVG